MRVWVVDNGSQWTHREWRVLRYLKQDTQIVRNDTPVADLHAAGLDGLVLSGGAAEVAADGRLGACGDYLDQLGIPILGICAGFQFMARHFGGKLRPGHSPEFGRVEVTLTEPEDELLRGIPSPTIVWENHNDDVELLPPGFKVLATSPSCPVQVMRHVVRPLFGTAFHPEVEHTEHGVQLFRNFLDVCGRAKARRGEAPLRA
jgi:GMP synthase (glutamine-hydrolysing)